MNDDLNCTEMYETGIPSYLFFGDDYCNIDKEDEMWQWTEIPGLYVSNYGNFYDSYNHRFVEPTHGDNEGHKAIKITRNKKYYQQYAHRLIAKAFIPNPDNYPIVRHLNDVSDDNCLDNLAWGTHSDNIKDALENGRTYTASPEVRERITESQRKPVEVTNINTGRKMRFRSLNESVRALNVHQANACKVLSGERSHTEGYSFKYISKEEYYAKAN